MPPKKRPPAPDEVQPTTALRHLIAAGEQFRHAVAAHYGVSESETMALTHLRLAGPLTPREVADRVGLTPSTVTALLDRLESAGLATRSAHPTDRRKTVVTMSDDGAALLATSDQRLAAALVHAGADVAAALDRVAAGIEAQTVEIRALPPRSDGAS